MEYEASIHPTILQLSVGSWLGSLVRPMYHTTRYVSLLDLASSASLNLIPRVTRYFSTTECSLQESDVYLVTCVPNLEWYSIFRE